MAGCTRFCTSYSRIFIIPKHACKQIPPHPQLLLSFHTHTHYKYLIPTDHPRRTVRLKKKDIQSNTKAISPTRTALVLMNWAAAPPVKEETVGEGGDVMFVVVLLDRRVKLAQVRRVVLDECRTMERLPKKEFTPATVVA